MRNVLNTSCRENQKAHFNLNNCFIKPCPFLHNVEKIQNALMRFHSNNGYANAPQCYVIVTLPLLKGF